jgi:euchromatic histone-lysine N-methyltransferase
MSTALHAACSGGHLSVVHILLQAGAQLDVLDRDQNTPLMLAAVSNRDDIVKYLVKAGADVVLKVRMCLYLFHNCDTALHFI